MELQSLNPVIAEYIRKSREEVNKVRREVNNTYSNNDELVRAMNELKKQILDTIFKSIKVRKESNIARDFEIIVDDSIRTAQGKMNSSNTKLEQVFTDEASRKLVSDCERYFDHIERGFLENQNKDISEEFRKVMIECGIKPLDIEQQKERSGTSDEQDKQKVEFENILEDIIYDVSSRLNQRMRGGEIQLASEKEMDEIRQDIAKTVRTYKTKIVESNSNMQEKRLENAVEIINAFFLEDERGRKNCYSKLIERAKGKEEKIKVIEMTPEQVQAKIDEINKEIEDLQIPNYSKEELSKLLFEDDELFQKVSTRDSLNMIRDFWENINEDEAISLSGNSKIAVKLSKSKEAVTRTSKQEPELNENKKRKKEPQIASVKKRSKLDIAPNEIRNEDCVKKLKEEGITAEQLTDPSTRMLFSLYESNMALKQENREKRAKNREITAEYEELITENRKLNEINVKLNAEGKELNTERKNLGNENVEANRKKEELEKENEELYVDVRLNETKYLRVMHFTDEMRREYESVLARYNSLLKQNFMLENKCESADRYVEILTEKLDEVNNKNAFSRFLDRILRKKITIPQFMESAEDPEKLSKFLKENELETFDDVKAKAEVEFNSKNKSVNNNIENSSEKPEGTRTVENETRNSEFSIENTGNERESIETTEKDINNQETDEKYGKVTGGNVLFSMEKYSISEKKGTMDMDIQLAYMEEQLKKFHDDGISPNEFSEGTTSQQMFLLYEQNADMRQENTYFETKNSEKSMRNTELTAQNAELNKENVKLSVQNETMKADNEKLKQINMNIYAEINMLTNQKEKIVRRNKSVEVENSKLGYFSDQIQQRYEDMVEKYKELLERNATLKSQYNRTTRYIGVLTTEVERVNSSGFRKRTEVPRLPGAIESTEQSKGLMDINQIRTFEEIQASSDRDFVNSRMDTTRLKEITNDELEK